MIDKYLKPVVVFCTIVLILSAFSESQAASRERRKNRKEQSAAKLSPYARLFDGKTYESEKGELFTLHRIGDKVLLELPLESQNRELLLATTPSSTMYVRGCVPGLRQRDPVRISFVMEDSCIVVKLHNEMWLRDGISQRVGSVLNTGCGNNDLARFEIRAMTEDGTAAVVDATRLFTSDIPELSPISRGYDPFSITSSHKSNLARIVDVSKKDEELYVHIRTQYTLSEWRFIFPLAAMVPTDVDVVFSLVPLPAKPMRPRPADARIGTFTIEKKVLPEAGGPIEKVKYAARWNLVPSDTAAYRRGELVMPLHPITMYMDPAMPESWKNPVKQGILRWNQAFEKIGFRDAIRVLDFPSDDPEFNPYGINTSCVWYAPSNLENAEGHFWTDPRTGEIRGATIVLHQHVAVKINHWRFVQTAQLDPRVRNVTMPREILEESLSYVAAHEMGHCLGLTHNMAGSAAIPVDSLRSVTFTNKFGTTASIMDYARFNYVAQPDDKGVRLTPPDLGVYDEYAIAWLYRYFPESATEHEVQTASDAWISRHAGDPMYRYAPMEKYAYNRLDPSAAEEDLSNDAMRAGEYGIRNLEYIMKHLPSWIGPANDPDGSYRKSIETRLLKQYQLYLETAWRYVGGFYVYNRGEASDGVRYRSVPREVQKRAVKWTVGRMLTCERLQNPDVYGKFAVNIPSPIKAVNLVMSDISSSLVRVSYMNSLSDDPYPMAELFDDLYESIWKNTIENRKLTATDKFMQREFLDRSELRAASVGAVRLLSAEDSGDFELMTDRPTACGFDLDGSARRALIETTTFKLHESTDVETLRLLRRLRPLLEKRVVDAADPADIPFYRAQLFTVNKMLKPKK